MGTSDPRNAATKLGVDRHEAPAADSRTLSPVASAGVPIADPVRTGGDDAGGSIDPLGPLSRGVAGPLRVADKTLTSAPGQEPLLEPLWIVSHASHASLRSTG
jgi:hypothetical protein